MKTFKGYLTRFHTEEKPSEGDVLKLLLESGVLVAALTAVTWITGWSYANSFFAALGLNLSATDGLTQESILSYAVWVFQDHWLVPLIYVLVVAGCAVGYRFFWLPTAMHRLVAAFILFILAAVGIIGAALQGDDHARQQVRWLRDDGYQNFPRVVVSLKKDSAAAEMLGGEAKNTCLRKVFMDRKALYVYPGYESQKGKPPDIYILPLQDVQGIKVMNTTTALCKS